MSNKIKQRNEGNAGENWTRIVPSKKKIENSRIFNQIIIKLLIIPISILLLKSDRLSYFTKT